MKTVIPSSSFDLITSVIRHLGSLSSGPFEAVTPIARSSLPAAIGTTTAFFTGTLLDQYVVLRAAAEAGAIAVDLEIESAERSHHEASLLRKLCALIISFHDFERTSALHIVWRRLNRVPADAYKLVTTIRKPSGTLRLVQFMREHAQAPLIAMGMSEAGSTTRILGPSLGSLYTYAAPSDSNGTASGQLSSGLLRSLYSCDTITQQTRLYGVVGDPISHTKSPLLHNRAFHSRRMDAVYLPFLVASSQLGEWMKLALALPIAGFSVTIPHKQRILRYLDAVEPLAHRIGAVNTVWRDTGKWRGTNTDVDGVLKPLSGHLRLSGSSVLIVGYGGAARAAAFALHDAGASVTITGRDAKRARLLARAIHSQVIGLDAAHASHYDVLINATPVGMSTTTSECLFPGRIPANIVFDMVYNPHETNLLKAAQAQGCVVIHGIDMLLEQAARQFEIWTGEAPDLTGMSSALA